jgi:hypothetical protein
MSQLDDNDALRAELAAKEQALAATQAARDRLAAANAELTLALGDAQRRVGTYREALEWYANPDMYRVTRHYQSPGLVATETTFLPPETMVNKARAALASSDSAGGAAGKGAK